MAHSHRQLPCQRIARARIHTLRKKALLAMRADNWWWWEAANGDGTVNQPPPVHASQWRRQRLRVHRVGAGYGGDDDGGADVRAATHAAANGPVPLRAQPRTARIDTTHTIAAILPPYTTLKVGNPLSGLRGISLASLGMTGPSNASRPATCTRSDNGPSRNERTFIGPNKFVTLDADDAVMGADSTLCEAKTKNKQRTR